MHACSVMSDSVWSHGLLLVRLLCPWNFPGKSTGVGCHFLLQGIFPTQGLNRHLPCLLHWQADSFYQSHPETPRNVLGDTHISFPYQMCLCIDLYSLFHFSCPHLLFSRLVWLLPSTLAETVCSTVRKAHLIAKYHSTPLQCPTVVSVIALKCSFSLLLSWDGIPFSLTETTVCGARLCSNSHGA